MKEGTEKTHREEKESGEKGHWREGDNRIAETAENTKLPQAAQWRSRENAAR